MIQFNLLPDIKVEYIRAERTKRTVMAVSVVVVGVSVALAILLTLVVFVFQKSYITDLTADIKTYQRDLESTTDLDKILTVQNQLKSITALHDSKPDTTRLFPYIEQLTPLDASISSITVDFDQNTMIINGAADSLRTVNQFVDTLKFTSYTVNNDANKAKAFSTVVLTSFGRADKGASYSIDVAYDPIIFSKTDAVSLTVPDIVSTRSETEKPSALFETVDDARGGQ